MSRHTWNAWDYIEWTTYRFFQAMPLQLALGTATVIGKSYLALGELRGQLWVKRLKDTISRVLSETDPKTLRALQYNAVADNARTRCEFALTERLLSSSRVKLSGLDVIADKSGPFVFVGAHLGNWEFMIHTLVQNGIDVTGLYEPPPEPARLKIALATRARTLDKFRGTKMVPSNTSAARKLVRAIDRGSNLWIAVDEFRQGLVWGPKLGRTLPYTGNRMLAARLAIRAKAHIVPIRCRRLSGSQFEVTIQKPLEMPQIDDEQVKARAVADEISRIIEVWVKEDLTQWYQLLELRLDRKFPGTQE